MLAKCSTCQIDSVKLKHVVNDRFRGLFVVFRHRRGRLSTIDGISIVTMLFEVHVM